MEGKIGGVDSTNLINSVNHALISDYARVFYVSLDDDTFVEVRPRKDGMGLFIAREGEDFFGMIRDEADRLIYAKDTDRVSPVFYKANLRDFLASSPLMITYRRLEDEKPVWHTLKVKYADGESHVIVAIRNIDELKRREMDYETRLTEISMLMNRDALTGVKNKNAYEQEENRWNEQLSSGKETQPFAVVVCDINDLKIINDLHGHKMGDAAIIETARMIGQTFKRSPVFRIGGDEFAVVLTNSDYGFRHELLKELRNQVNENMTAGKVVVASGMAVYEPGDDRSFEAVFQRADREMYRDKRDLKRRSAASEDDEDCELDEYIFKYTD